MLLKLIKQTFKNETSAKKGSIFGCGLTEKLLKEQGFGCIVVQSKNTILTTATNAQLGKGAVVEANALVGINAKIGAYARIEEGVHVGHNVTIEPWARVTKDVPNNGHIKTSWALRLWKCLNWQNEAAKILAA